MMKMRNFDRQPARASFSIAAVVILLATAILISLGCAAETSAPPAQEAAATAAGQTMVAATQLPLPTHPVTLTPTSLPSPTVTATPSDNGLPLEITENSIVSNDDVLGQINVEYPLRMSPGSSDGAVIVSIRIPDALVSIEPMSVEIITIPPDAPPIIGARGSDEATILIADTVRVELNARAFQIGSPATVTKPVNIEVIDEPTFWTWTLVAPDTIGSHSFTLNVYRADEANPTWTRIYQIEVSDFTPTPTTTPTPSTTPTQTQTPTTTPSPTMSPTPIPISFMDRPGGTAIIGAGGMILAALITGLVSFFVARDSFPFIGTKASYRRTLKTLYANLARLEGRKAQYGLDVPTSLENEIEVAKERIAETEARLEALGVNRK
jgi:hypothetical protein